jgi:hypothetical protein
VGTFYYKLSRLMSVSLKCSDLIPQYDGSGDFSNWVKKLELVAELQKIEELHNFLPLFLHGGAFTVYESLHEKDKRDYNKLKQNLTSAFCLTPCAAYQQFISRQLGQSESVDVYFAELRRLAALVSPSVCDNWLKTAFINGLPVEINIHLQAACSISNMKLQEVVEKARSLISTRNFCFVSVGRKQQPFTSRRDFKCYSCGEVGHIRSKCPKRVVPQCFICGSEEHFASTCPQRKISAKNE